MLDGLVFTFHANLYLCTPVVYLYTFRLDRRGSHSPTSYDSHGQPLGYDSRVMIHGARVIRVPLPGMGLRGSCACEIKKKYNESKESKVIR